MIFLKGYKKNTNKDSIIIKDNLEKKNIKSDSENHKIINQMKLFYIGNFFIIPLSIII